MRQKHQSLSLLLERKDYKEGGVNMNQMKKEVYQWLVPIIYVVMIGVNAAAVLLPMNGMTTQEVSDSYSNLFAPAGLTFSIWSVIYLLLGAFVVYQWIKPKKGSILADRQIAHKLRLVFIMSSVLNGLWLVVWQYLYINITIFIMLGLLITLIYCNRMLAMMSLTKSDYFFIRLPFSVYFGWITIATIANITAFLVDKNIAFLQDNQQVWTVVILLVGVAIIGVTIIKNRDIAYGIATLWAYYGILVKHRSADGWNGAYPVIITTVMICLLLISLFCLYDLFLLSKKKAS